MREAGDLCERGDEVAACMHSAWGTTPATMHGAGGASSCNDATYCMALQYVVTSRLAGAALAPNFVLSFATGSGSPGYYDSEGPGGLLNTPWGVASDASGAIIVADYNNHCIRKVGRRGWASRVCRPCPIRSGAPSARRVACQVPSSSPTTTTTASGR